MAQRLLITRAQVKAGKTFDIFLNDISNKKVYSNIMTLSI